MISAILPYRREGQNLSREDSRPNPTSQFRATSPLAARAKTGAIFVKKTNYRWAIRYRPTEPPPSPRDENSTLVTKSKSGMSDKSDPAGTLRDLLMKNISSSRKALHPSRCFASDGWAASRLPWVGLSIFVKNISVERRFFRPAARCGELPPHLEFSYRTIPLRRIRFACRLIADAKFGRNFRQEKESP